MKIRAYNSADCAELAKLFYDTVHAVAIKDYTQMQLNVWASGKVDLSAWDISFLENHTLIAEQDGTVVGFGEIKNDGYLNMLYTHKDYQGKGIATAIVAVLENTAKLQGITTITTHASITAIPFFEKRGYMVVRANKVIRENVELTNFLVEKNIV